MSRFQKATRTQSKARIALVGPSGSGKTYTGLVFARELVGPTGRIAVIDTERGSASKYAGTVTDFDVLELDEHDPRAYMDALYEAGREGYEVVLIDSLTHAWNGRGGALELVDQAARAKSSNSFAAWREVTPIHNALVDAILTYPGHVIVTMRAKTEYVMEQVGGKSVPRKVGLAPVQRDGMEYEFDVVADIDHDHTLVITKTRCDDLDGLVAKKAGQTIAAKIRMWLEGGAPAKARPLAAPKAEAPKERPAPQRADTTGDDAAATAVAVVMQKGGPLDAEIAESAEHLRVCEDADSIHGWFLRWLPMIGRLDKGGKREAWDAMKARGVVLGFDEAKLVEIKTAAATELANASKAA